MWCSVIKHKRWLGENIWVVLFIKSHTNKKTCEKESIYECGSYFNICIVTVKY